MAVSGDTVLIIPLEMRALPLGGVAGFIRDTAEATDSDFVFALAYRACLNESREATTPNAKIQVAYLLDRLMRLDWRD
jgi:hypothetical protein